MYYELGLYRPHATENRSLKTAIKLHTAHSDEKTQI